MMLMAANGGRLPKLTASTVDTDCEQAVRVIYYDLSADNTCAWLNFDLALGLLLLRRKAFTYEERQKQKQRR